MGIKQTSEMLTRWGRAIRGENTGEAKRDTGFVKSIFGSFGYSAPAVDDVDASRERADTMIFHMDVDKITKIIDDLDGDTKRILYIRFVNSNNKDDGLRWVTIGGRGSNPLLYSNPYTLQRFSESLHF